MEGKPHDVPPATSPLRPHDAASVRLQLCHLVETLPDPMVEPALELLLTILQHRSTRADPPFWRS
jgi:hypothetical protein